VTDPRLLDMENPEAYLLAMTPPLALAREDSPFPVARIGLEAVASALIDIPSR
jgi:hypothetical protein